MANRAVIQEVGSTTSRLRQLLNAVVGRQELVILGVLALAALTLSLLSENFFQSTNLLNLARGVSWFAVAALGVSMVILIGGIDLSVGAVMALSGLVCALMLRAGLGLPVAIGAGLLTGTTVGLLNGSSCSRRARSRHRRCPRS